MGEKSDVLIFDIPQCTKLKTENVVKKFNTNKKPLIYLHIIQ